MSPSPSAGSAAAALTAGSSVVVTDVATRAKAFDPRHQETIERARLRRLQPMLETVGHRIGGSLSSALRQPLRVELTDVEQSTWEDYAGSLPDPTFLTSAVLLPLEGRCLLHLPVQLCLAIVDYYLGGDGVNEPGRDQLTDIEKSLVGGLTEVLWNEIPQPFASFAQLSPAMVATASSAMLIQVGRPGALCVIARMHVALGDAEEFALDLCVPASVVRNLIGQLERHQTNGPLGADRHGARRRLLSIPVEARLAYPPIGLTPTELLGLQVGDVIHLGTFEPGVPQALPFSLGDVVLGTGVLVEQGNRLACTVLTKKEYNDEP